MGTGFLGLLGVGCLYVAWFRRTFSSSGLLPTSDLWEDPEGTWPKVVGVGAVFLLLSYGQGAMLWTRGCPNLQAWCSPWSACSCC